MCPKFDGGKKTHKFASEHHFLTFVSAGFLPVKSRPCPIDRSWMLQNHRILLSYFLSQVHSFCDLPDVLWLPSSDLPGISNTHRSRWVPEPEYSLSRCDWNACSHGKIKNLLHYLVWVMCSNAPSVRCLTEHETAACARQTEALALHWHLCNTCFNILHNTKKSSMWKKRSKWPSRLNWEKNSPTLFVSVRQLGGGYLIWILTSLSSSFPYVL